MRQVISKPVVLLLAAAVLAATSLRGVAAPMTRGSGLSGSEMSDAWNRDDPARVTDRDRPERKEPSFWHRPNAASATLQLLRARRIEAAGSKRSATRAYDALVHTWHDAPEAPEAQQGVARLLEARGKYDDAFDAYQYLLCYFADSVPADQMLARQFAIANHYRAEGGITRARRMFAIIARTAPQWPRARVALLQAGLLEEEDDDSESAAATFERVLGSYPGSDEARDAAYLAARCRYHLAQRFRRDETATSRGLSAAAMALRDYPDHPEAAALQTMLAEMRLQYTALRFEAAAFYDNARHPPSAALAAYRDFLRRCPAPSPQADTARRRIAALEPPPDTSTQPAPDNEE